MRPPTRLVRFAAALGAVTALGAGAFALAGRPADPDPTPPEDPPAVRADWLEVDRLLSEQKLAEAAKLLEHLEAAARERSDDLGLARVLVRQTQVGLALGGYETAVEALRARAWPEAPLARATVELYDAHALLGYLDAYDWEIRRREKVVSGEALDLKLWTADQIVAEADRAFARVWAQRTALGELAPDALAELHPNDYPEGIRPTLRDAVAYLWAERLADSAHWSPRESADLWKLDLDALAEGRTVEPTPERLSDPDLHPLEKLAAILGDLERWHRGRGERGATLEAKLERISSLHDAFTAEEDRGALAAALEQSLGEFRSDPWWSMAMARLAGMIQQGGSTGLAIRQRSVSLACGPDPDLCSTAPAVVARALALAGEKAYPRSPGAEACRVVRDEIEAPSYELQAMAIDAADRRSIEVSHRNLPALHLRAYRLPDERFDAKPVTWGGWNQDRVRAVLRGAPAASWKVDLPATADYRDHRTFTTPPLAGRGRFLLVASADPGFRRDSNLRQAVELRLSDLVVLRDPAFGYAPGADAIRVVSGATGAPIAGAEATLYRWQWEKRPEKVETRITDADGLARFELPPGGDGRGIAVVVRHGGDEAVWSQGYWWRPTSPPGSSAGALVFTDRAIYRPGQKLLWKILVYEGEAAKGSFRAVGGRDHVVELLDPNGEVVATGEAKTNDFGTAAGELEIPTGRLLGNWTLRSSANGSASIAVEEYKRPTFEVSLEAPAGEPRLNRPLEVPGEARYYFGLPVASGKVSWRVVRAPMWEWARHGWFWRPPAPPRTIASGVAELDAEGKFAVRFTPEADERERDACGCYRFTVETEITDEGGETRSAARSIAIGWVGVTLAVDGDPFLVGPQSPTEWTVRRRSLDGEARAGTTTWRLVELAQPARAPLPAELPRPVDPDLERWATPGDRLRPRWEGAPDSAQLLAGWNEAREVGRGTLAHGEDGAATLALGELAAGAYRLIAGTKDAHGETFTLERSFAVADRGAKLAVPLELRFESPTVAVGGTARLFVHSGLPGQTIVLERLRGAAVHERHTLLAGRDPVWVEWPIDRADRGGFGARATVVADHQVVSRATAVAVPWDDRGLTVELTSFRDKLEPGATETFRVAVKDHQGRPLGAGAAELLASMYDRSLDYFRPFAAPRPSSLYPAFGAPAVLQHALTGAGAVWREAEDWWDWTAPPVFSADAFVGIDPYGIGGPGFGVKRRMMRGEVAMEATAAPAPQAGNVEQIIVSAEAPVVDAMDAKSAATFEAEGQEPDASLQAPAEVSARADFSETAFWQPHLVTAADGTAAIEFRVPESLTSWKLWVAAVTRDLASGYVEQEIRTAKDLMVRPYLPRFLREGDRAELRVAVDNASEKKLSGEVRFRIEDPDTQEDLSAEFGLPAGGGSATFAAEAGQGTTVVFPVAAPSGVRPLAFRVEARAGALSDGELRPIPVLPSRIRLAQSRFAALTGGERRELVFEDLAAGDPTRIDERMVVTVDGQLFYGLLDALPYLVEYPYECTEQTLNRFVSAGVLGSMFDRHPGLQAMAAELAKRDTRWERFDAADPNRRMALEETPWLRQARGGPEGEDEALLRVLDPQVARAVRAEALAKLERAQLPSGAFPWFPGGPPSPYMTLYLMYGLARASEFGVEVPEPMVRRGWTFLAQEIERDWWKRAIEDDCCWELLTFANYVASSYPDPKWMESVLPARRRREILDFSFKHWKQHSPMLKLQLALTLTRMERPQDARLVLASVMDSAKSDRDLGTFWAPEDRAWLWYNDTIETHAWALRALSEVAPEDARDKGLVQWLFLNKKLGHWKSTRATAEVLFSVAAWLQKKELLGTREELAVTFGGRTTPFVFEPDRYSGKKNQIVLEGDEIVPARDATIVVEQKTDGFAFASATWHFSTEQLPAEARGDLFHVERRWFRRVKQGAETTLEPLAEGARLAVGDELEVQLSVRAKAAAEYVHLRDPRAAGLEPDRAASGWRWDLGIVWYEEVRDSGTNFFFEWLPAGEYTLKYRVRAATAGEFRVAPAELQSMYAPEFVAYSAGARLAIAP